MKKKSSRFYSYKKVLQVSQLIKSEKDLKKKQLFKEEKLNTTSYFEYLEKLEEYYNNSVGTTVEKLYNFPKLIRENFNLFYMLSNTVEDAQKVKSYREQKKREDIEEEKYYQV